jgi:hypothetical protein
MASTWHRWYFSKWAWFSIAIQTYAKKLVAPERYRSLDPSSFRGWFTSNEAGLRIEPYQQGKNIILAMHLLPLMEKNAEHWDAICSLPDSSNPLRGLLTSWQFTCPEANKCFVSDIFNLFFGK